mgnify:CR=1 FL=1
MTHSHSRKQQPSFDPWTDDSVSVDDPSTIIATIPGTLGYYPQESIIVIGLVPDLESGGELVLGPVLRADLQHAGELADFLETAPVARCVAFLGIMVTRRPQSSAATAAAAELEDLVRPCGAPLVDVLWHVSEIAQGTPYEMVFGPDPEDMDRQWPELRWGRGTVASVVSSPTMRAWHDNGILPALDRSDTFEYFQPDDSLAGAVIAGEAVDVAALTREAARHADELRARIDRGQPGPGAVVRAAMKALQDAPAQPIIGLDERVGVDCVFHDAEGLRAMATVLSRSMLRDCVIGTAVRHPEEAATALLAVARAFDGVIRANALSLWGIVAISRGLSSWASAALAIAQEEMPEHSMSAICLEILAAGQQQHLVTTILQGCELACAHIIEGEDYGGEAVSA